jgi:hypothetical protein
MPLDPTPVYWLSAGSCALAGSATVVLFCWSGYQDWGMSYAVVALWHVAPYFALGMAARHYRDHLITSLVWLGGTLTIAYWHIFGLVAHCNPRFPLRPPAPGRPGVMNCAGPIIEVFFPFLMFGAMFLLFLIIAPILWMEMRVFPADALTSLPLAETPTAPAETAITATHPRGDSHVQRRSF